MSCGTNLDWGIYHYTIYVFRNGDKVKPLACRDQYK